MATRRRRNELPEPEGLDLDGDIGGREPIPSTNRRADELSAALQARVKGKPRYAPPPELSAKYRPYWIELVNSFSHDHFTDADLPLLKLYCRAAYDVDRLDLLIEEEGDLIMGGKGPVVNPRIQVRQVAERLMLSISTKFRAQPASRNSTDNFKNRQGKASASNRAASAVQESDGLLAGGAHRLQ